MPPHGGLNCTVSSCRTSCLLVDIGCLLVEILVSSALPPCGELLSPCGELRFSTSFRCYNRASCVFLFPRGLVRTFSSSSARRFCSLLDCSTWTNIYFVVTTLRTEFFADITIGLCDSRNIVVMFCLHRLRDFPCYDLHRSTYLLSFSEFTVGLLLYLIL